MSYNSEICLECWEESNEVHFLKKPLTEVGSCNICPWDACWFQSRLSKNKETKFLTVLQLISWVTVLCISLVRTAWSQKSTHFNKAGINWKSSWSFGVFQEILAQHWWLQFYDKIMSSQSSAVLHKGKKNILVCWRHRTYFTVNLIYQVETETYRLADVSAVVKMHNQKPKSPKAILNENNNKLMMLNSTVLNNYLPT